MIVIDARNLPRHVGIIMDGNGRWAELRGEPREAGHKAGSSAVRRIVQVSRRIGLEALALYAFSEQNWGRPVGEVDALMGLLREYLLNERVEILTNAIRLVAIGDLARLPDSVREVLEPLRAASAPNKKMTLALALSYGGREEIAGVFVNRLNRGMRLQTDPTVIYALGDNYDGNITRKDLQVASPFNTYRVAGLPPAPIALPSQRSIEAVLKPATTQNLYFVARGDGSHMFSATLEQHNKAVQQYQIKSRSKNYRSVPAAPSAGEGGKSE